MGSKTKRARFVHRFERRGIAGEALARLTCPIGVPGIVGKEPEVIAVAAVAQLLAVSSQPANTPPDAIDSKALGSGQYAPGALVSAGLRARRVRGPVPRPKGYVAADDPSATFTPLNSLLRSGRSRWAGYARGNSGAGCRSRYVLGSTTQLARRGRQSAASERTDR
ncbi:MAG TPA: XdhC family protein [Burkholderiaceae bacterium]|nr:XdhC family protein [Burkholderiaceae bacterium]